MLEAQVSGSLLQVHDLRVLCRNWRANQREACSKFSTLAQTEQYTVLPTSIPVCLEDRYGKALLVWPALGGINLFLVCVKDSIKTTAGIFYAEAFSAFRLISS
jgi:hypothetical protein